jgi:hypothetical protein
MSARRGNAALGWAVGAALALLLPLAARAVELRTDLPVLGQVRSGDGYMDGGTQAPIELYTDMGLSGLPRGITLDTYARLEEDFANYDGKAEFYSGVVRMPAARPGLDVSLGRQIVSEVPLNIYDADSGTARLNLGGPYSISVFGGQPQYWEPTYSSPSLSQDEQIFGGSLRATPFQGGAYSLGFLQQNRQGRVLKQLVTLSGVRSFSSLPGLPNLYGNFAYDADRQNIDQVRVGTQTSVWQPELLINFESGYYKPQDNGKVVIADINRREDPIFQAFSVSQMLQFRGGARYAITPTVSTYGDLSYQRYEQLAANTGSYINGYVWSAGLLFLPGGDGLESLRTEYYGIDSGGGTVNGVRGYYENRVYDRILFRAKADVAYYEKATNQNDTVFATLIGLGYMLMPGLVAEVNFEANRNQLFPEDFRFGFFITYNARYQTNDGLRDVQRTVASQPSRPFPWGPAQFGPAAWGTSTASWSGDPSLPTGWNGNQAYATASLAAAGENPANWVPKPDGGGTPAASGSVQ